MDRELLLSELHRHLRPGHENALGASDLAYALGCSERLVGALCAELVDDGHLIGSSCEAGRHGYFIITTPDDLDIGTRHIRSRAIASWDRISKLKRNAATVFGEDELRLFDLAEVGKI